MADKQDKKETVCEICGHLVKPHEGVSWLTGVAHLACKNKAEGQMRSDSDTILGKKD